MAPDVRTPLSIITIARNWWRRHTYREGRILSRFIACDVRRDILIISAARIEEGVVTARVRTTNVLYVAKGIVSGQDFEPISELRIDDMWHWTGASWGGLPDGTSCAERSQAEAYKSQYEHPDDGV